MNEHKTGGNTTSVFLTTTLDENHSYLKVFLHTFQQIWMQNTVITIKLQYSTSISPALIIKMLNHRLLFSCKTNTTVGLPSHTGYGNFPSI